MLGKIGLFAFSCSLIATQYLQLVTGDAPLLARICAETPEPGYCQQCFQSNPTNIIKNATELGLESIACSYSQTLIVRNNLDDLLQNSTDAQFKKLCYTCKVYIVSALLIVENAQLNWLGGKFNVSSNLIGAALDNYQRCAQRTANSTGFSPEFDYDAEKPEGYYEVAKAVLLYK